jgi:hypothetical protein
MKHTGQWQGKTCSQNLKGLGAETKNKLGAVREGNRYIMVLVRTGKIRWKR